MGGKRSREGYIIERRPDRLRRWRSRAAHNVLSGSSVHTSLHMCLCCNDLDLPFFLCACSSFLAARGAVDVCSLVVGSVVIVHIRFWINRGAGEHFFLNDNVGCDQGRGARMPLPA